MIVSVHRRRRHYSTVTGHRWLDYVEFDFELKVDGKILVGVIEVSSDKPEKAKEAIRQQYSRKILKFEEKT